MVLGHAGKGAAAQSGLVGPYKAPTLSGSVLKPRCSDLEGIGHFAILKLWVGLTYVDEAGVRDLRRFHS